MSRRDVLDHLRAQGCEFYRQGGRHEMWWRPASGHTAPVPRHRIIKRGIVRSICRLLDIPLPPGL
ncbi:MAG: type II toxin-antitoxin system HicA family toxin [Gemmataceae bacterium]